MKEKETNRKTKPMQNENFGKELRTIPSKAYYPVDHRIQLESIDRAPMRIRRAIDTGVSPAVNI